MRGLLGATTTGSLLAGALSEPTHGLVVAYGAAPSELDRWLAIDGTTLVGRASPNFGDAYRTLSRRHAEIALEGGAMLVRDLGSRFGTLVNGVRAEGDVPLYDGDVVTFGRVGMVVASAPLTFVPRPMPPLVFVSWRIQELLDDLAAAARTPRAIALVGPPGTGKRTLARTFASLVSEVAPRMVGGREDLAGLSSLDAPIVVLGVRDREVRAFVLSALAHDAAGLVVVAESADELRADDLGARLDGTTFHVPALSERREDILPVVRDRLRSLAGRDVEVGPELALALLMRPNVGGVRGLLAWIDRLFYRDESAVRARGVLETDRPLYGPDADVARPPERRPAPEPARAAIGVARDGTSLRVGGERVDLDHRKPLVRILARLARAREANVEGMVDRAELIAAGWPNESILPTPAAHRLHVAISTLRALGLADVLVRRGAGYALVGAVELT